jgi:hypothetical protein
MDMQKEIVTAEVNALTEDDMIRVTELFGMKEQLSFHLLSVLKWITAYKMQLFLYIKANGVDNISTSNVWGGFDMPPKQ